jgi:hypothetical protein
MAHRKLRRSVLPLVLLATVFLASTMYANGSAPPQSSSSEDQQIGKVLSVRKVLLLGIALPSDHPTPLASMHTCALRAYPRAYMS